MLPSGYHFRQGSQLDRALLLKFMHLTYLELSPEAELSPLTQTIEAHFSQETPLWWVDWHPAARPVTTPTLPAATASQPIACLWLGTAIDQVQGYKNAYIFLLYVKPEHRRQGIGTALMHHAERYAQARGDRQIGLQVFQSNQAALSLYQQLGYRTQSLWLVKPLAGGKEGIYGG